MLKAEKKREYLPSQLQESEVQEEGLEEIE